MDYYQIEFSRSAERDLRRLSPTIIQRVHARIQSLSNNPRPRGAIKLSDGENSHRIRIGDYRVIYNIDDTTKTIIINYIRHRREVYRQT